MKEFFECMRCYSSVIDYICRFFLWSWPVWAGYAALYVVGAAIFLANLRANKDTAGSLYVATDGWAYMLAHPYRYGQIRIGNDRPVSWHRRTSICVIYARAFNALLTVWPVLLLYFAITCGLGSLFFGLLLGAGRVRPNLSNDGFLEVVDFYGSVGDWQWYKVPAVYLFGGVFVGLAIFKFALLAKILLAVGTILVCTSPAVAIVVGSTFVVHKVRKEKGDATTSVGMLSEYVAAHKEKFCKMVAIK